MISFENTDKLYRGEPITIYGLSTDEKPTTMLGMPITNGSQFFEIDTKNVAFFNQATSEWV